jgi:hypothetical protein
MLSIIDMQRRISQLRYFPGWHLSIYEGNFEGTKLLVKATVDDYTGNQKTVDLKIARPIDSLFEDERGFDIWLVRTLNRIMIHESMEALRTAKDGKPVIDPHRDGADMDLI